MAQIFAAQQPRGPRLSSATATDIFRDAEQHLLSYIPSSLVDRIVADPIEPHAPWREDFLGAVAFVDVSGFTALSEKLKNESGRRGAELLNQYMNSYFEQLIKVVAETGGDVIKFAGDALQVVWRDPPAPDELLPIASAYTGSGPVAERLSLAINSRKSDLGQSVYGGEKGPVCPRGSAPIGALVVRAVKCCMQLLNELNDFSPVEGVRLTLHVGIGAGAMSAFCVGGEGGRWEYFVAGEPIEQMAIATDLAASGQLALSRQARALLVQLEAQGRMPVPSSAPQRLSSSSEEQPHGRRSVFMGSLRNASPERHSLPDGRTELASDAADILRMGVPVGNGGLLLSKHLPQRSGGGVRRSVPRSSASVSRSSHSQPWSPDYRHVRTRVPPPASPQSKSGRQVVRRTVNGVWALNSMQSAAADVPRSPSPSYAFRSHMRRANPPLRRRSAESTGAIFPSAQNSVRTLLLHVPVVMMKQSSVAASRSDRSDLKSSVRQSMDGVSERPQLEPEALRALRCFVPPLIDERLAAGQAGLWVSEHRVITTVFLKLLGLGHRPCEPAQLGSTHAAVRAVQEAFTGRGGTILRLITDDKGTRFLIAFGLPGQQHEDEVSRAVCAAVEAAEALKAVSAPLIEGQEPRSLGCAVGVTTGRVFCGEAGCNIRREYTLMGSTVNMAARLMQAAEKLEKSILVDEETSSAVPPNACTFAALAPITVKGRADPLPIFTPVETRQRAFDLAAMVERRLMSLSPSVAARNSGTSVEGSMVSRSSPSILHRASVVVSGAAGRGPRVAVGATLGREAERAALQRALESLQDGEGGAVVLLGEAGIGKTQMAQVLSHLHDNTFPIIRVQGAPEREPGELSSWRPVFRRLLCDEFLAELATASSELYPLTGSQNSSSKTLASRPSSAGTKSGRRLGQSSRTEASTSKATHRPDRAASKGEALGVRAIQSGESVLKGDKSIPRAERSIHKGEKSVSLSLPPSPPPSPPPSTPSSPAPRTSHATQHVSKASPLRVAHSWSTPSPLRPESVIPTHREPPQLPASAMSHRLSPLRPPPGKPPPMPQQQAIRSPEQSPEQALPRPKKTASFVNMSPTSSHHGPAHARLSHPNSAASDLAEGTMSNTGEPSAPSSTDQMLRLWRRSSGPLMRLRSSDVVGAVRPECSRGGLDKSETATSAHDSKRVRSKGSSPVPTALRSMYAGSSFSMLGRASSPLKRRSQRGSFVVQDPLDAQDALLAEVTHARRSSSHIRGGPRPARASSSSSRISAKRTPEQRAEDKKRLANARWRRSLLAVQAWQLPLRTVTSRGLSIRPDADARLLNDRIVVALAPLLTPVLPTPLPNNSATRKMVGTQRQTATLRVMSQVLEAKLGGAPAAIVIGDADKMDESSWALLAKVLQDIPSLLVVLELQPDTYRPAGAHAVLRYERTTVLRLQGLREPEIGILVERTLGRGSVPSKLASLIHRRCDGNPLYAMEMARSLLQEGNIKLSARGEYVLAVREMDIALPTTVEGLITSRIDRLPADQQMWLKLASVLGVHFTVAALHELSRSLPVLAGPNAARSAMQKAISGLIAVDMLRPTPVSTKGDYEHTHGAVHAAAYSLLPAELKATLHMAAARYYDDFILAAQVHRQRKAEAAAAAQQAAEVGGAWGGVRARMRIGRARGKAALGALADAAVCDVGEGRRAGELTGLESHLASLSGQKLIALGEVELARKARHHWVRAAEESGDPYVVQQAVRHLTMAVDAELSVQAEDGMPGGFLYTSLGQFSRTYQSAREASLREKASLRDTASLRSGESTRDLGAARTQSSFLRALTVRLPELASIRSESDVLPRRDTSFLHGSTSSAESRSPSRFVETSHSAESGVMPTTSNALEMSSNMVRLLEGSYAQPVLFGPVRRRLGQAMLQLGQLDGAREELQQALLVMGASRVTRLSRFALHRKLALEWFAFYIDRLSRSRPPEAISTTDVGDIVRCEIAKALILLAVLEAADSPRVATLCALQALWHSMRLPVMQPALLQAQELLADIADRRGHRRRAVRLQHATDRLARRLRTSASVAPEVHDSPKDDESVSQDHGDE